MRGSIARAAPSLPSMLIGRPSTKPMTLRSAASASTRAASAVNALRATVSTPVARRRAGSDTATPMVLVPRSSPINAPRAGRSGGGFDQGQDGCGHGLCVTRAGAKVKVLGFETAFYAAHAARPKSSACARRIPELRRHPCRVAVNGQNARSFRRALECGRIADCSTCSRSKCRSCRRRWRVCRTPIS